FVLSLRTHANPRRHAGAKPICTRLVCIPEGRNKEMACRSKSESRPAVYSCSDLGQHLQSTTSSLELSQPARLSFESFHLPFQCGLPPRVLGCRLSDLPSF